jgi:hypothetical protein
MKTLEHPEVLDIRHICDVSPHTPLTKDICNKINTDKLDQLKELLHNPTN